MLMNEPIVTHAVNDQEHDCVNSIKIYGIYEHYSGKRYNVIGYARSSEDLELNVIYKALYACAKYGDNPVWHRPLSMFLETVMIKIGEEEREVPRFKLIADFEEQR